MDDEFDLQAVLSQIVTDLTEALTSLAPRVLTALVILVIGLLVAIFVRRSLRIGLAKVRFDVALDKIGIARIFKRIGIQKPPSAAIAQFAYFLIVILVVQTALEAVGLYRASAAIGVFFAYLPNILAAVIVLLLGNTVGQFAGRAVEQAAGDSGIDFAAVLGRMVTALVIFVVVVMAISQLDIDTLLVQRIAIVLLAGFALSFSLTFGLGTRDITRNMVAGFYAKRLFTPGDEIEVDGERGVLRAITPMQTVIEKDDGIVAIPNDVFLQDKVKR